MSSGSFLLLIPQFFGIFLLWNIVEIAIIVHHPTAIDAEGVFVPLSLALLAPLLTITVGEADACVALQVDAYCYRFVFYGKCQCLAILDALSARCS